MHIEHEVKNQACRALHLGDLPPADIRFMIRLWVANRMVEDKGVMNFTVLAFGKGVLL